MIAADNKLWFRTSGKPYQSNEPCFYDPNDFEWAKQLMNNYAVIREELSVLLDDEQSDILKPYFEQKLQSSKTNWKTEGFYFWTRATRSMINLFPKTHDLIKEIPGLVTASINLLESNSKINEHTGDTNAIYRCHLGLKIPAELPECGFRVRLETRMWKEGEMLIFTDAYPHEAFNFSEGKRYILQLDILRPQFRNRKYYICTKVLGITILESYIKNAAGLREKFEYLPLFVQSFCIYLTQIYTGVYLFLQRNIFGTHLK
jgi:aspartyl/asparaginyl beta-hydroxylase (cupin superfamily)